MNLFKLTWALQLYTQLYLISKYSGQFSQTVNKKFLELNPFVKEYISHYEFSQVIVVTKRHLPGI